jgi:hypothetical protein
MTTQKKYPMTELAVAVGPARERHRELIEAARAWQAGHERPTDPDLFAMICAAADEDWDVDLTPTRWERTGVASIARCGIPNWCSRERCEWPDGHLEAMWRWFDFLLDTGRMDPRSDPVAELRKPLACYGGFDQRGHALPPGAPRQIACECHLPYRETTELLNELVHRCERSGQDPLDVLRGRIGDAGPFWSPLVLGDDGDQMDRYGSAELLGDLGRSDPWDDPWADPDPGR